MYSGALEGATVQYSDALPMIQLKEFENCFNQFNTVKGGQGRAGEASLFLLFNRRIYYYRPRLFKVRRRRKKKGVLLSYSNSIAKREREIQSDVAAAVSSFDL